jgi:hypothetical protein
MSEFAVIFEFRYVPALWLPAGINFFLFKLHRIDLSHGRTAPLVAVLTFVQIVLSQEQHVSIDPVV